MKSVIKSAIAAGALLAASASQASLVTITFDNTNALAAHNAYVASLVGPVVVENFDSLADGSAVHAPGSGYVHENTSWEAAHSSFTTNVGTFVLSTAGLGSSSLTNPTNANNDKLLIESKATGESGREVLSNYRNDLWLDSNDARLVTWTLGAPLTGNFNSFGFYLADVNDTGGILKLNFANGGSAIVTLPAHQANGNLGYVTVRSSLNIVGGVFKFVNNSGTDGWGIDDVVVGNVPEPGALMLMGLGLLGLGAARRYNKA